MAWKMLFNTPLTSKALATMIAFELLLLQVDRDSEMDKLAKKIKNLKKRKTQKDTNGMRVKMVLLEIKSMSECSWAKFALKWFLFLEEQEIGLKRLNYPPNCSL